MNITLTRTSYLPDSTSGQLEPLTMPGTTYARTLYSIEQPWNDNEKGKSCVPEGVYELVPYASPTHGRTWYLKNHDLGVGAAGEQRSFCEIHSANWARQLQGCIALGFEGTPMLDPATGKVAPAVERSHEAVEYLLQLLGPMTEGHTITIQRAVPTQPENAT